jgi:hypothetical protein
VIGFSRTFRWEVYSWVRGRWSEEWRVKDGRMGVGARSEWMSGKGGVLFEWVEEGRRRLIGEVERE